MITPDHRRAPRPLQQLATALSLALLLWLFAPPSVTLAEDDYETLVSEALAEFQAKNWPEARALFMRAHELSPNARTLRGAGIAAYQDRLYVTAYHDLTAALQSKVKPLTKAQRKEVESVLARTQTFIARVRLDLEPQDAEITVDGNPGVLKDGALWLDPGVHDLVVRAPGHEPTTQRLDAEPSAQPTLQIALKVVGEPLPQSAPEPGTLALSSASGMPTSPAPSRFGVWPWLTAGVAVVFVGTAIGMHLASSAGADAVKDACPPGTCSLSQVNARIEDENIQTFDALAVTSWALAGAAAATSVVLFTLGDGSETHADSASARTSVRLSPGLGSVRLHGQF